MKLITLELTETEIQALVGLIDSGLKATGLRGAKDAVNLIEKIEAAILANKEENKI